MNTDNTAGRGMGWFKFIINFQLFASAVMNSISGIRYLTGSYYEGEADLVYAVFPSLKGLDIFMGVASLGMAAFALVIRGWLANFLSKGPKAYLAFLGFNVAISLLYVICASSIIGESAFDFSVATTILTTIALLIVSVAYFGKRADMFT